MTKFVIKTDDDIFVDIFVLIKILERTYKKSQRFIMCNEVKGSPIIRNSLNMCKTKKRLCIHDDILPGQSTYPRYCSGASYFYTTNIVHDLYETSLRTSYFFVEDVYITGFLIRLINDRPRGNLITFFVTS